MRWATRPGAPGGHVEGLDAAPGLREAVDQVEGVSHKCHRRRRGDTQGQAERFGCEGGNPRGALTAQRLVGLEVRVPAPGSDSGVGGGGVQDAPLVGEHQLVAGRFPFAPVGVGEGGEQRVGSEVVDPGRGVGCLTHGSTQALPTDIERGLRSPCPQGIDEDSWTVTTAVDRREPQATNQ